MLPVDFIAWLRGYTAAVGENPPTPEQWKLLQDKLAELHVAPVLAPAAPPGPWPTLIPLGPFVPTAPRWPNGALIITCGEGVFGGPIDGVTFNAEAGHANQ